MVEQRTENPRVGGSIPPLATIFKSPNSVRAFSRLPATPVLAALRRPALRASLLKNTHFSSVWASLFPVLSVCLASVREVSYCIDAGFCAVGCGWKVAAASDRSATNKPKRRALLATRSLSSAANPTRDHRGRQPGTGRRHLHGISWLPRGQGTVAGQ